MREGVISCTLLARFVRNGAFRGAVIKKSPSGTIFRVHCCSVQGEMLIGRYECSVDTRRSMLLRSLGVGAGEGGAGAPCAFQRLRLGGKALDGELARLVPRDGPLTSARTDANRYPARER